MCLSVTLSRVNHLTDLDEIQYKDRLDLDKHNIVSYFRKRLEKKY